MHGCQWSQRICALWVVKDCRVCHITTCYSCSRSVTCNFGFAFGSVIELLPSALRSCCNVDPGRASMHCIWLSIFSYISNFCRNDRHLYMGCGLPALELHMSLSYYHRRLKLSKMSKWVGSKPGILYCILKWSIMWFHVISPPVPSPQEVL